MTYKCIPVTDTDRHQIMVSKPPGVEWMLFASYMLKRMDELEPRWRDFEIGYIENFGERVRKEDLPDFIGDLMSDLQERVDASITVFDRRHQERAFGREGEVGDFVFIQHLATRIVDGYSAMLDWAETARSLRLPTGSRRLREELSQMVREPLEGYRDFVKEYTSKIDELPELLASSDTVDLDMTLRLTLDEKRVPILLAELQAVING